MTERELKRRVDRLIEALEAYGDGEEYYAVNDAIRTLTELSEFFEQVIEMSEYGDDYPNSD